MNIKQKEFIIKTLIPYVLRDQGRGFAMDIWKWESQPQHGMQNFTILFDKVMRDTRNCGSVCCIGGSTEKLLGLGPYVKDEVLAKHLGLTLNQARRLFFGFDPKEDSKLWPKRYINAYHKANTTLTKAKVACSLLRKVVATNGKVLNEGWRP